MTNPLETLREEDLYKTIEIEKLRNRLKEIEKTLGLQFDTVFDLSTSPNISATADRILNTLSKAMSLDELAILLYDEGDGKLHHFSSYGLSREKQKATFSPGEGISGMAFQEKKSCIIDRVGNDPRFKHWGVRTDEYKRKTFLSIPLTDGRSAIGVIDSCADAIPTYYRRTLESLAALMTPIIRLQRAKGELEKNFFETIKRVMDFTEALSPYTSGHSFRVSRYAGRLARDMGLPKDKVESIEKGARVHDIGKIAMMDMVRKRGRLTPEQRRIMNTHPLLGEQFIRGFDFLKDAVPIIKYHHERYDGRGYPGDLKGKEIPLSVRIVTVAEVFDAMTTDRSYRGQHSFTYAVGQLKRYSGKQFDPAIVRTFIRDMTSLREFSRVVAWEAGRFLT